MQRWQVEFLENPNYKRTEKQIHYVMNHPPPIKGWSRPKPVTDFEGWGIYGGTPWAPGVYRLQHYDTINHKALPVNNKNGDDPDGVLYIGKAETWLWSRVKSLRNTHFYGNAFLHYPLEIELQQIYPKERLAISWQALGDGNEAKILEKNLLDEYAAKWGNEYGPLNNKKRPSVPGKRTLKDATKLP
jgi:hypothetical protein